MLNVEHIIEQRFPDFEKKSSLRQEIQRCELLGETQDGKQIYLSPFRFDSCLMREIGRLREIAFRAAGEGTGTRRDVGGYDRHCFVFSWCCGMKPNWK